MADRRRFEAWRRPLIRWGIPHLYVSYAGWLCYAYQRGRIWHTGVLYKRHRVWRER